MKQINGPSSNQSFLVQHHFQVENRFIKQNCLVQKHSNKTHRNTKSQPDFTLEKNIMNILGQQLSTFFRRWQWPWEFQHAPQCHAPQEIAGLILKGLLTLKKPLHPQKLKWQCENNHLKMYLLLKMVIFHCPVSFRGCKFPPREWHCFVIRRCWGVPLGRLRWGIGVTERRQRLWCPGAAWQISLFFFTPLKN